jgi:ClpP class serine protease
MSLFDLFWIFFLFSAVSPMIQKKILDAKRVKFFRTWEQQRGSRVIALIHRQETMSILGFPLVRYIDIEDSEEVLRAVRLTEPQVPIDIILHTPGGMALAAEQIAYAIKDRRVTVFVPHYAMSGGTLIALAADEIVMDPNGVLGSLDPQLGKFPAASILQVVKEKDRNEIDDETLILADIAKKAIRQLRECVREIVEDKVGKERAEELADILTRGEWTHDHPLTAGMLRSLGLPVSTAMPKEIYEFMRLFPQAGQRRPSVEYIPLPYDNAQGGRSANS